MMPSKRRRMILILSAVLIAAFLLAWAYVWPREGVWIKERMGTGSTQEAGEEVRQVYVYEERDQELLQKYQAYNPDVAGIITIPGTVLNHPVMQTKEEESYYLSRDLDGNANSHGIPYLSKESVLEGEGGNRIIYGHNIHKISRDVFADLAGYEDLDFYKEHPVIYTVSESGTRRWLIFAYFLVDTSDEEPFRYSETTYFLSRKEFQDYFEEVDKRNWLDVPAVCGIEDTYLTLSSCANELPGSGTCRMVVMAKQLYADEPYGEAAAAAKMRGDPLLPARLGG